VNEKDEKSQIRVIIFFRDIFESFARAVSVRIMKIIFCGSNVEIERNIKTKVVKIFILASTA